jgi:hypothetical protein
LLLPRTRPCVSASSTEPSWYPIRFAFSYYTLIFISVHYRALMSFDEHDRQSGRTGRGCRVGLAPPLRLASASWWGKPHPTCYRTRFRRRRERLDRVHDRSCGSIGAGMFRRVRGVRLSLGGYQREGRTEESSNGCSWATRRIGHLTRTPQKSRRGSIAYSREGSLSLPTDGPRPVSCRAFFAPSVSEKRQTHAANATSPGCLCSYGHAPGLTCPTDGGHANRFFPSSCWKPGGRQTQFLVDGGRGHSVDPCLSLQIGNLIPKIQG